MLVTSSAYFVFLAAVLLLFWPLARWRRPALAVLLMSSYFFWAKWDIFYLALIPIASAIDFAIGAALARWRSRWLLALSLALNIGLLAAFKYFPSALSPIGAFPIGLSFYAFQAMSYTIDIYRRDAKPASSLLDYFTAVSFFPTVLSGPITRPASLIPQFAKRPSLTAEAGGRALFLIALGAAKKFLIADYLAANLVNRVFDYPKLYSGLETLLAVYAYALQLYFDFSGYTDIVLGSAALLGLTLPPNFNRPYLAANLADFWRRWHISLSNWLRDYVYFSFPGLRGAAMPYVALIATMLIGGIWHGATANFLVWGALHGLGLAVVRFWQQRTKLHLPPVLAQIATFHFVCFAWIFFRASTWDGALAILTRIASLTFATANISLPVAIVLSVAALSHVTPRPWLGRLQDGFVRAPALLQAAALLLLIVSLHYLAATGAAPFVYTKF